MYETEFPSHSDILHFNHAGIAPWPTRTVKAVQEFAQGNTNINPSSYIDWEKRIFKLRHLLARLIGADSSKEIALTKNTSEGISIVALGIQWNKHDHIIVAKQEFPSNRFVWESLAERYAVNVQLVDFSRGINEDALISCITPNTRLLACSSIQYATGYKMNLEKIGAACHRNNTLFCIDAIQSLGAVPFNAQAYYADFVCADGHKWLLSPESTGILYCKRKHIHQLKLNQYGWHMCEQPAIYDAESWQIASDATRFECGSMNNLGLCALYTSVNLLFEIGLDTIHQKINQKINYLIENIDKHMYEIITPLDQEKRGGILTVKHHSIDSTALFKYLRGNQVFCAQRAGGVRFSPHFYTSQNDLDCLVHLCNHFSLP